MLIAAALLATSIAAALASGTSTTPVSRALPPTSLPTNSKAPFENDGALKDVSGVPTGPAEPVTGNYTVVADPSAFNPSGTVELTIGLSAPALLSTEQDVNNPGSPDYRHYLSYAETQELGAAPAARGALVTYLESYGLTVSGNDLSLNLAGTVAQVESALHTTLGAFEETYNGTTWDPIYDHITGIDESTGQPIYASEPRVFYSNLGPVEIPSSLAGLVSGISGLNGLIAEPQISAPMGTAPGVVTHAVRESTYLPSDSTVSSTGPGGAASVNLVTGAANYTWGSGYWGPGENLQLFFPSTMPTLYGALPLWTGSATLNGTPDYGQGITIAVIEVGCVDPTVFESFSNTTFGNSQELMGRLTYIALGSDGTGIGSFNDYDTGTCVEQGSFWGWSVESALDVEYAATMAPHAHIDLLSVPSADWTAFDAAYQFAAEYLIGNQQCDLPTTGPMLSTNPGVLPAFAGITVYGSTSDEYGGSACDASLFSNSYGTGEQYVIYEFSSMYVTVENTLLEAMAAEGATSLVASGDHGGVAIGGLNDEVPADSPAVTSVGGGQITAMSGTEEFPATSVQTVLVEEYYSQYNGSWYNNSYGYPVTVAPVTGTADFTYWSGELVGVLDGQVSGGFGQSMSSPQAWWQNGLDTYSMGARIDPTVSGQAAFNMTIWYPQCFNNSYDSVYNQTCEGPYLLVYGGTSFATPLMAGDLALIEEQLQVRYGEHALGDANPMFFAAHNAYEASGTPINPFEPMVNIGCAVGTPAPGWCQMNSWAWYAYNYSWQTPMDQGQPPWFATLSNPAIPPGWTPATQYGGSSLWNYLQGLGLPEASLLDKVIVGQTWTDHALYAEPFYVEEVGPNGALEPITTLTGGVTYTFEVQTTISGNLPYDVTAYSGGGNNGTYGGGSTSSLSPSSSLTFRYTPIWTDPRGPGYEINATTYGYFLIRAPTSGGSNYWSFQAFAVAPPPPTVALQLCVDDIYGVCQTGSAEVAQFMDFYLSDFYNVQTPTALVTLNGLPVESASVVQTSVVTDFCTPTDTSVNDCTMNSSYYAPGQAIGEYLTDARGTMVAWVNAWTAEINGSVAAQAYTLTAYLNGLASNTVTVWVEPQTGSFYVGNLTLGSNGLITGMVYLNQMMNLEWSNISLTNAPSVPLESNQYVNESFVGVNNAVMHVSLNTAELPSGWPALVTETARGWNMLNFSYMYCSYGSCYYYNYTALQSPIIWQDAEVFLPATISQSATDTIAGVDTVSWSGTVYPGASGILSLVSAGGSTELTGGISGTYALNTSRLLDGNYSVVFTESAPGAVTTVRSVSFYADNAVAQLGAALAADVTAIASLQAQVTSLQASLSSANATIASLLAKISSLQGNLTALQAQLVVAQSTIASLDAENSVNASEVTKLQSNVTADLADIATLQSEVQTLQNELNAKKNYVAPAWYDTLGSAGVVALIVVAAIVVGSVAYLGGRRAGRNSEADERRNNGSSDATPSDQSRSPAAGGPANPGS